MRRPLSEVVIASSLIFFASSIASGLAYADGEEPIVSARPALLQARDWTGFYANGGVGYGLWDAETTTDAPGRCVSCAKTDHAGNGWLGEVGLGYDYQFTDRIVGGVLFNFDYSDLSGKIRDSVFTTAKTSQSWAWFIGARVGWLMTPDILNYWSVGYTQTHFSGASLHNSYTDARLPSAHLDSYDAGGWFIGSGLEVALHHGWFWRGEVRYADYGKKARTEGGISPVFQLNFDPVVGTATNEIVYKFDWGH